MNPPMELGVRHRLDDGTTVTVRTIRPTDRDALHEAFRSLSPESRYSRFHAYFAELTPSMLRYLTEVDGVDHYALVAVSERRIVAVARFIRFAEERAAAEVALTVIDAMQGRGLARLLSGALVDAALERGILTFHAHTLLPNGAIRRLLARHGELTTHADGGSESLAFRFYRGGPSLANAGLCERRLAG